MVDVWATADFKAEWFFGTVGDHFVDFDRVAISVAELPKRALFFPGYPGGVFGKADLEVFGYLLINDGFDLGDLLGRDFLGMAKVEAQALLGNIAAALNYVITQSIAQSLVHEVRSRVVFLMLQRLSTKSALECAFARRLAHLTLLLH